MDKKNLILFFPSNFSRLILFFFFFFLIRRISRGEGIAVSKLRANSLFERVEQRHSFIHLLSFQEISINVVVTLDASRIAFQTDDNNPVYPLTPGAYPARCMGSRCD